jgi:hypothetical protein
MGSFSNDAENKILDHVVGGSDYARPATLHLALLTTAPTDASTGSTIVEANYTGYQRKAVTNNSTNFPAASNGLKSNGVEIVFDECTAGSSTVSHFAICDASSAGNVIAWGSLGTPRTYEAGVTPRIAIGDLQITLD